jgi:hypothetical protein
MFKLLSTLLFFLSSSTALIKDCDTSSQFKLRELALYPDPPVKGQNVYMTVIFDNPGPEITDGYVVTSVTLNGIPFSPSHKALCGTTINSITNPPNRVLRFGGGSEGTECPLVVGINNRSTMSVWPSTVSGKINSKIQWVDIDGKSLLCIQTSVAVAMNYEPVPKNMSLVERSFFSDKYLKHNFPTVSPYNISFYPAYNTSIISQPKSHITPQNKIVKRMLRGSSDDDSEQSSNTGSSQQSENQIPQTYSLRKHRNTYRN